MAAKVAVEREAVVTVVAATEVVAKASTGGKCHHRARMAVVTQVTVGEQGVAVTVVVAAAAVETAAAAEERDTK